MSEARVTSRYARQERVAGFGLDGQKRLAGARVAVLGLGALGSVAAELLARAGVGRLRLIDRDVVEVSNLQRQVLYSEADALAGLPKAEAAAGRLGAVNSAIELEAVVADVTAGNIGDVLGGADVVVDGTDNAQARYLLNDWCVKQGVAWVYGAGLGWEGRVMGVVPAGGETAGGATGCLRCVFPSPPRPGEMETCETAGVMGAVTAAVAAWQVGWVIKRLAGLEGDGGVMTVMDLRSGRISQVSGGGRDVGCVCCGMRRFEFLEAGAVEDGAKLCGRDVVQVRLGGAMDLEALAGRLAGMGGTAARVERSKFMVRVSAGGVVLTCFADGRVLVAGVKDVAAGRGAVAKWVGV